MENVIQLIACNTNYARVHCIGFGSDVQRELIINGAKQGKGLYVFIGNRENCSAKIIKLLTDTLSPVIDNMKFEFDESLV